MLSSSRLSAAAATVCRPLLRLRVLAPLAIASTVYLYLFPIFHGCAFPYPADPWPAGPAAAAAAGARDAFLATAALHMPRSLQDRLSHPASTRPPRAPFRLLALGDPQLEGDTSIPNYYGPPLPHLWGLVRDLTFLSDHPSLRERVRHATHELLDIFLDDGPLFLEAIRKRVDLVGNDWYLAHNLRTLRWWTRPTHVTVLGDLLGSQWIDDTEFERRGRRFWDVVMRGIERVPDELAAWPAAEYDLAGVLGEQPEDGTGGRDETADELETADERAPWARRAINVAGNHDIGYGGDLDEARLARFERLFGKANYELRFEVPLVDPAANATIFDPASNPDSRRIAPELRLVILNDMNLDTPVLSRPLQDETYRFINAVIDTSSSVEFQGAFTIVLTHVPLYKPEGVCEDPPMFDFFPAWEGGGVREQNQLSADASRGLLEGIYGLSGDRAAAGGGSGRRGVVVNGHDHAGCDTYHFINQSVPAEEGRGWEVRRWGEARAAGLVGAPGLPGLREITARSMMGNYGGYMGLLSAWFDEEAWEWRHEFTTCAMGSQYRWWGVHMLDAALIVVVLARLGRAAGLDPVPAVVAAAARAWEWAHEAAEDAIDWLIEGAVARWRARRRTAAATKAARTRTGTGAGARAGTGAEMGMTPSLAEKGAGDRNGTGTGTGTGTAGKGAAEVEAAAAAAAAAANEPAGPRLGTNSSSSKTELDEARGGLVRRSRLGSRTEGD